MTALARIPLLIGLATTLLVVAPAVISPAMSGTQPVTDQIWRQAIAPIERSHRLDYSKGLVERFHAFEGLLEEHPGQCGKVTMMQVAPPSRGEVGGYSEIRRELETAAGNINGHYADFDWVPTRYLNKSFDRDELTCFYRASRVGLVAPLRDGMNLVAREFVASQSEKDPGVLVLSRFAGAAHEMDGALIVNPYDIGEVTEALYKGLTMAVGERRNRWKGMLSRLRRHDVHAWRNEFLDTLREPLEV